VSRFNSWTVVVIALLASLLFTVSQAAEPPAELDIRDPVGNVIIAADQIQFYDGASHTLNLVPAARAKLATSLLEGKRLVSGVPFSMCVGGKPIYDGMFTTSVSSKSQSAPTIVMAGGIAAGGNQLHIQLGYPTDKFFKGQDPRADKRIEQALRAAGKLADTREDRISWVAQSLLEMQSIKQGSTREELLNVFVKEGGLSNRFQRRYAYRDCPYFKVDVKFNAADNTDEKNEESPNDTVSQISTPFLEWTISD
jgi:hypothetical protein